MPGSRLIPTFQTRPTTDLFVSSVGVEVLSVGGCRGALSAFVLCVWFFCSSFVAAAVGGGASCAGGRVVRGGRVECGDRAGGGGVCRERAAVQARVGGSGASALRRRSATGRPPKLDDGQVNEVRAALEGGAQAHGFEADLWTLERVGLVVERVTGVWLSRASVWRLLTGRLGWSLQRPERRAVERDESERTFMPLTCGFDCFVARPRSGF
ncbi:winged helix-turn-helix domain-containing protein [Streptomyces sp. NPDC057579]|uniref:winged helix-turn-helix domain-containing protein n=1 Tax=Streptomyces sp. NPDC057579 TaxID=3346172 RepID=UPI0036C25E82